MFRKTYKCSGTLKTATRNCFATLSLLLRYTFVTAPEHLLTAHEHSRLLWNTYKCSGRDINRSGTLTNCSETLTNCTGTLISVPEDLSKHVYFIIFIIVFSSCNNTALSAQPYLCIWPVNKAVFLFYMQLCVSLYRLLKGLGCIRSEITWNQNRDL